MQVKLLCLVHRAQKDSDFIMLKMRLEFQIDIR
jgi:hypothetical protein